MRPRLIGPRRNPRRPVAGEFGYCERGTRGHVVTAPGRRCAGSAPRSVIVMELGEVRESRAWQAVRRHPLLCDAAFALVLAGPAIIAARIGARGELPRMLNPADLKAISTAGVAVAIRRLWTRAALLLT